MTDLDEYWPPPLVDDVALERKPRLHRHHFHRQGDGTWLCFEHAEPVIRDEVAARRGKSSRRLGGDTERRIEKVYGPVKIGERGDPVDHLGRVWKWQSKATRLQIPKWLSVIERPVQRFTIGVDIARPYGRMKHLYGTRSPVVIRSFVRSGTRTRDWLFVGEEDARDQLGLPFETFGWWVIPGDWWLDHFGLDS
jgi:hypothetical protein